MTDQPFPRLALASWDHAWLTRNDARQGPYRQLAQCLDALVERGYNALAIDAFPHLVASRADGVVIDRFQVRPAQRATVQVMPRRSLLELTRLAHQRGLRLWLGSAFLEDAEARRSFVRRPGDFVDIWSQTLNLLKHEGLLEAVVAVDFCRHFPLPPAAYGASRAIFGSHPRNLLGPRVFWSRGAEQRTEEYLLEVPRKLRALFPEIAFGVSANVFSSRALRRLDTSELDFFDQHLWLDDDPMFALASGRLLKRASATLHRQVAALAWRSRRDLWQRHLSEQIRQHHDFARVRRLQPVLGAGYIRLKDENHAWLREISEFVVETASECGVPVLCPAVQARPHGGPLWQDISWQRSLNALITHR